MKKTLTLLIVLLALAAQTVVAHEVTRQEADRIAAAFLGQTTAVRAQLLPLPTRFRAPAAAGTARQPFYIYNVADEGGFVIVSGDDALGTIIGYSNRGNFSLDGAPDNLTTLMTLYAQAVEMASSRHLATADAPKSPGSPVVEPLLGNIEWGQAAPFNLLCPTYTEEGKTDHYYVGCVATAMAQIMRYHKYPNKGKGSKTYTSNIGQLSANFGETEYKWNLMPERLESETAGTAQEEAVATLCRDLGVAVSTTYTPTGSGAFSQMVAGAMQQYFRYDDAIAYYVRDNYGTQEWLRLLKDEIDNHRPVYYSASNEDELMGGHAFVCDGYDSQNYVHVNWGWYGRSNGYFLLGRLSPEELGIEAGSGGYNLHQEMITGIHPDDKQPDFKHWPIYGAARISFSQHGDKLQLMSFIESHASEPFKGELAAVLVPKEYPTSVFDALKAIPVEFKAFDPSKEHPVDGQDIKIEDIPTKVGYRDGDYQLKFGYRSEDGYSFSVVRQPTNLPDAVDLTIKNGRMVNIRLHTPKPQAMLRRLIKTDGPIYAKGSACFNMEILNESNGFCIGRFRIKMTDTKHPSRSYILFESDSLASYRIYDHSTRTVNLYVDLPEEMPAGHYRATVFEAGYENYPFSDGPTGRNYFDVLPETASPVIRQTAPYEWYAASSGYGKVMQGEALLVEQQLHNYGSGGKTALKMTFTDAYDNSRSFDFIRIDHRFTKSEDFLANYTNLLRVDPGNYRLTATYSTPLGDVPVGGNTDGAKITVSPNPNLMAACEHTFEFPDRLVKGQKVDGLNFTIRALKEIRNGTFYLRILPLTMENGEIVYMKPQINLSADATLDIPFSYKPSSTLADGHYLLIAEMTTPNGDGTDTRSTIGNYICYHRKVAIGNVDGIETIHSATPALTLSGRTITFSRTGEAAFVEVYTLDGVRVYAARATDGSLTLPLAAGLYVVKVSGYPSRTVCIR